MHWISSTPILLTDFNTKTDTGVVRAIPDIGLRVKLSSGTEVRLEDSEGNTCRGIVQRVAHHGYVVVPVWSTWSSTQVESAQAAGNRTSNREAVLV